MTDDVIYFSVSGAGGQHAAGERLHHQVGLGRVVLPEEQRLPPQVLSISGSIDHLIQNQN